MMNIGRLFALVLALPMTAVANAQTHYYPNYAPYQGHGYASHAQTKQSQKNAGFNSWKNWMENQLKGNSWQNGDGNIFQDAKGFYQFMGNGKTKWKFYFDVDFQMEMDAWLKGQGKSKANPRYRGDLNNRYNQQYQQYWNNQGQLAPGYYYGGQGYVYPQQSQTYYPNYYGQPAPQNVPQR